jgi:CheY-like chemotaxis protein
MVLEAQEPTRNVLIVDDDAELASLLAQVVSDVSDAYDVKMANDVDGAMVQVHRAQTIQRPFDLVITDIKMLGLSGLELLEALKSITPDTKTITMTAYNSPELAERAQELNVYAYLTKPFVLSEFRQIVRSALFADRSGQSTDRQAVLAELSASQRAAISRHLATLRVMIGAAAALLMRRDGTLLAVDRLEVNVEMDDLCATLTSALHTVSEQMAHAFAADSPIRQSYFGTEGYSICTYRLKSPHFAAVVFGPEVKEGQVWYYMREAATKLEKALLETEPQDGREPAKQQDVFAMLGQFFPDLRTQQSRREESTPVESAVQSNTATTLPEHEAESNSPTEQDDPTTVQMGQSTPPEPNEASEAVAPGVGATAEAAAPVDPRPLDDIDWQVPIELDWDEIADNTDQGFPGIDFDEARKRGLISDVQSE